MASDPKFSDWYFAFSKEQNRTPSQEEVWKAALASREEAPAASGLPQGKPTDAMVEAGMRRMFDEKRYNASWDDVIALIFMDMVKAASAQPCASQGCGTKGAEEWYGDKSPLHQTLCMHPDPCGECDRIAALGIGAQQDGKESGNG